MPNVTVVLAVTLGQAKTIGIAIVVGLVLLAIAWAGLMKTLVQKAVGVLIILVLAALVWFQRDSLQECADKVRQSAAVTGSSASLDTTCSFFGQDIEISVGP